MANDSFRRKRRNWVSGGKMFLYSRTQLLEEQAGSTFACWEHQAETLCLRPNWKGTCIFQETELFIRVSGSDLKADLHFFPSV